MPKITINEIDSSRYVSPTQNAPMTVLVPGTASFGPVFQVTEPAVLTFNGAADISNFYNCFGSVPAQILSGSTYRTLEDDICFEYVTNLLRSGATVQFYRLNEGVAASSSGSVTTESELPQISAKYTGSFANYFVVQIKAVGDTDAILSVYKSSAAFTKAEDPSIFTVAAISKMLKLYSGRVSVLENSQYYIGTNQNQFVEITPEKLQELINEAKQDTNKTIAKNLFGGADYTNSDMETVETTVCENLIESYAAFSDPYLFDFDFVTSGGFVPTITDTSESGYQPDKLVGVHNSMVGLCEDRKDCIALIDTAFETSPQIVSAYAEEFNTSYAAIYAPWCSIVSATTAKTIYFPPSLIFLKAILYGMQSQTESELWYVPAGVSRASAPFIVSPEYEIGSTILNDFQNDKDYRVNPIMRLRNYGYCVYGNSTLLQSVPGVNSSALESMNVRLISNVIKKRIFEVCCGLSFEYNNADLWLKFYTQMDETLLYMKRHYGLYDYQIMMDASTVTDDMLNERRVPGKILISPTLAGEYFDIDFEIMPSGVTFKEGE